MRIGGEYLWFWVTLFVSLLLYIPLFLLHRGIIKPGTSWYSPNAEVMLTQPSQLDVTDGDQRRASMESGRSSTRQSVHAGDSSGELPSNPEVLTRVKPKLWSTIL